MGYSQIHVLKNIKLEVSKRKFIHVDTQFITKNRVQIQQLILIL